MRKLLFLLALFPALAWGQTSIDLGKPYKFKTITLAGTTVTGIDFTGTYTGNVIDFTDVTIDHTGSNGPALLRAGTYASPLSNSDEDQSGLLRLYTTTDAGGTSYDRGIFMCSKTTNTKGVFPIAGLAEVNAVPSGNGPTKVQAGQFISHLNSATAKLAALGGDATAGMYGAWLKVTANDGATTASGSRVAPLWVDNQLYGSNINAGTEEYGIFATAGGTSVDAFVGFETSSVGWDQLFYFDETAYDQEPVENSALRVKLNTTQYYIPLSTSSTEFVYDSIETGTAFITDLATATTTVLTPTSTGLIDTLETTDLATADITVTGDWVMDTVTIAHLIYEPPHGMVSFHDSSTTLTMSTGVFTHVTNAWYSLFSETDVSDITFAGDSVTIAHAGSYMMNIGLSLSGTASDAYEITLYKNHVQTGPIMERTTSQTDVGYMGLPIYLDALAVGDDLKLMIRNTASDDDATVIACSWTLFMLHP